MSDGREEMYSGSNNGIMVPNGSDVPKNGPSATQGNTATNGAGGSKFTGTSHSEDLKTAKKWDAQERALGIGMEPFNKGEGFHEALLNRGINLVGTSQPSATIGNTIPKDTVPKIDHPSKDDYAHGGIGAFDGFEELLKSTFGGAGTTGGDEGAAGPQQQMSGQITDALSAARRVVSRRLSGIERPQFADAQKRFDERWSTPSAPAGAAPAAPAAAPASPATMGRVATDAGVTVTEANGKPSASYEYNGTRIDIPDGMDLNDDEVMGNFIASNNEVIDWMNGGNDEEEDI